MEHVYLNVEKDHIEIVENGEYDRTVNVVASLPLTDGVLIGTGLEVLALSLCTTYSDASRGYVSRPGSGRYHDLETIVRTSDGLNLWAAWGTEDQKADRLDPILPPDPDRRRTARRSATSPRVVKNHTPALPLGRRGSFHSAHLGPGALYASTRRT